MNNKVFYQHPNLMRALGMHETVMEVMVNVLGGGESKVKQFTVRRQNINISVIKGCYISNLLRVLCLSEFELQSVFICFLGNHFPKDGGKLLSFSMLFLPHQQAESKSYV